MRRIRIIHRLRTFLAIIGFLAVAGLIGVIGWANQTGLPDPWRQGVVDALARQGIHADLASLRFIPFRGFEAGEVVVYSDPSRERVAARLEKLLFDLDRSKLTRGDFQVDRLNLSGARFSIAADPLDPESETLDLTDMSGQVEFSGPRSIHISRTSGMIHGIRLDLDCQLDLFRASDVGTPEDQELARLERRRILLKVIHTLHSFELQPSQAPRIRIEARGDLEDPSSLRAMVNLRAKDLRARNLTLKEVNLSGELRGSTLVVHHADVVGVSGKMAGRVDYDLSEKKGRFDIRSSLDLVALCQQLKLPLPEQIPTFGAPPVIEANGDFASREGHWDLNVIGHASLTRPRFGNYHVDHASASFAWDGEQLLLEDLEVTEGEGRLTGRIFFQPDLVRYSATSTLPLELWQRSIPFEPLRTILGDFSGGPDLTQKVVFHGHAHPHHAHDWSFIGTAEAQGISYQGVPTRHARVDLDLAADHLDFRNGEAVFNYDAYPLKLRHGGPDTGRVNVDLIRYDHLQQVVEIKGLEGDAWPAPIVRTFAPKIADLLENYGFHRTPHLVANGVVGVMEGLPKQDLRITFETEGKADYVFLGENIVLDSPKGIVRVLPQKTLIENLTFGALGGSIRASIASTYGPPAKISGAIDWTELNLENIAKGYHFDSEPPGLITGRADFSLEEGEISTLNGKGHIALEDAQLFDVPILGPLSPVAAAVLGNRKAGFQEANSAFLTFEIEDGVLRSNDFLTTTRSLVFTGDGYADLNELTLDMIVRMNARGFFGMLTLPLKPFYGLFQFRGTGPLKKPVWDRVMFTSPPDEQNEKLLAPPKAKPVGEPAGTPSKDRAVKPRKR